MELTLIIIIISVVCAIAGGFAGSAKNAILWGAILGAALGPVGVIAAIGIDFRELCPMCKGRINNFSQICPHCRLLILWRIGKPIKRIEPTQERPHSPEPCEPDVSNWLQ